MEKFFATKYTENSIELKNSEDLEKLYQIIDADENFILQWYDKDILQSEVIITTNISSKVKNGDLVLTSKQIREE